MSQSLYEKDFSLLVNELKELTKFCLIWWDASKSEQQEFKTSFNGLKIECGLMRSGDYFLLINGPQKSCCGYYSKEINTNLKKSTFKSLLSAIKKARNHPRHKIETLKKKASTRSPDTIEILKAIFSVRSHSTK